MSKKSFYLVIISILFTFQIVSAQEETQSASKSNLTGANLPLGAVRINEQSVPPEINQALQKMVDAGDGKLKQGESEVLAWTGSGYKKSSVPQLIQSLTGNLQTLGWTYETSGQSGDLTLFSLFRSAPAKRAVIGFYTFSNEALVIAWTEVLPTVSNNQLISNPAKLENTSAKTVQPAPVNSAAKVLNVEKQADNVNVMGNEMPKLPAFPVLSPKGGKVRGYVKDMNGKPLPGAHIGVRSTLIGGAYSGASGDTDANGYYEFAIPQGVAHYYNAGYTIEYGDGLAAMSLHAVDGKLESFASPNGAVENFVLLSYGITSRENLSENPHLPSTYYGGSIYIGYWAVEAGDMNAPPQNIPVDSVIEITLTSEGELFGGVSPKSFVIRKTTGFQSGFRINNIPVGRYRISARLANGKPLKMRLNKPRGTLFGMTPAETTQDATILFDPNGAKNSMVTPNAGNWNSVSIMVERP